MFVCFYLILCLLIFVPLFLSYVRYSFVSLLTGLVTQVRYGNSSYSFVLDSYVKFLEQAGAGVVGIR